MLSLRANSSPSGEVIVIWVEACSRSRGASSFTILARPRSCTITASTPAASISSSCASASSSSLVNTSVLNAT